jgi:Zn-dependent peptidase ImmA (M78 family)
MRIKRDANGIPVIDEQDIELIAEHFLGVVAPDTLQRAAPTPLLDITTKLQSDGLCTFRLDLDLGVTKAGHKVLGYFDVKTKEIAVDCSLIHDDPRFPFTLAHEIGHFYLHSKVRPSALSVGPDGRITDSTRDLIAHRIDSTRPRSLMEWQANHFAANALLPRQTVPSALLNVQKTIGVVKNLGIVWHDPSQSVSRSDLRRVVDGLSHIYRVSRAVVKFRLYELRLVKEHVRGGGPIRVGDVMGTALRDLFADA